MIFLCIIDDTPELETAIHYAAHMAKASGGEVAFLYMLPEPEGMQQWAGVAEIMEEEARADAETLMRKWAWVAEGLSGDRPQSYIRSGDIMEELPNLLAEEPEISHLILAAANDADPGPLINAVTGELLPNLKVPVTLVPGNYRSFKK